MHVGVAREVAREQPLQLLRPPAAAREVAIISRMDSWNARCGSRVRRTTARLSRPAATTAPTLSIVLPEKDDRRLAAVAEGATVAEDTAQMPQPCDLGIRVRVCRGFLRRRRRRRDAVE